MPNLPRPTRTIACALAVALVAACSSVVEDDRRNEADALGTTTAALKKKAQIARGREIWLTSTFGGEKFFSLILPEAPFNLPLGLEAVLTTPRAQRFTTWGVINDPDCTDGDASTGHLDRCPDATATGIVGVRKGPDPTGTRPFLIGVACASCHAGFEPTNPPADPSEPEWKNIHLTTGNQYIAIGKIFGANLSPHDPRYQVFATWAPGTVDTTAIESDGINNPGIITQFFEVQNRPYFTNHYAGVVETVHRGGQGGEDDAGCERAALRVYFNIGMCAKECMVPHLTGGPGGTQTPIDQTECAAKCSDFVKAQTDVVDECAFMNDLKSTRAPRLEHAPGGSSYIDWSVVSRGEQVFEQTCASCHSNGKRCQDNVFSDDEMRVASGFDALVGEPPGAVGTNKCRALTTNWLDGQIWAHFSSDELKTRGAGFYRDVPLLAVWATAPFFHNNRLGTYNGDPSVAGRLAAYEQSMKQLLNPGLRDFAGSVQVTSETVSLPGRPTPLPKGTPVAAFANVNPRNGQNLCAELVENGGHYFGATLSDAEKYALTEFLKRL